MVLAIGAPKLMATSSSPARAIGSIHTGVSPHSSPCASPRRMPIAVAITTPCHAKKIA